MILDLLGEPLRGHGEPSQSRLRRNRRIKYFANADVSYYYTTNEQGEKLIVLKFYVEGPKNAGIVYVNAKPVRNYS